MQPGLPAGKPGLPPGGARAVAGSAFLIEDKLESLVWGFLSEGPATRSHTSW